MSRKRPGAECSRDHIQDGTIQSARVGEETMSDPESPPKPHRWKTFSLRTLMIFVLFIGASWTLTATWGVRDAEDSIHRECIARGFSKEFIPTFSTLPVAPFVLKIDSLKSGPVRKTEVWLWAFGYSCVVSEKTPEISILIPVQILDKAELSDTHSP